MASNPLIDPGPSPSLSVGTEEIAGVQYPFTKLVDATVGSVAPIGTAANPLPVTDSSTSTRKVKGETAVGGAVGDPVPVGMSNLGTGTLTVPTTFNYAGSNYQLVLAPDPFALTFVSYSGSGEQYCLTASTDSTKANSRYVRVSTNGNPLVAGDVDHDAADAGNPVKIGGKASAGVPTAVTANDRVNAYFDTNGYQHTKVDNNVSVTTSKGLGFASAIRGGDGFLGDEDSYSIAGSDGSTWNVINVDSGGNLSTIVQGVVAASCSNAVPASTTGNLSGVGSITATLGGAVSAVIQVSGTYSATMLWEVSFDGGTNYFGFPAKRVDTETLETTTGALVNATRAWEMSVCGATNLRMRCSAYTSGTVAVRIQLTYQGVDPNVVATIASGTITTVGTVTNITNQGHLADNAAFVDGTTRLMMAGHIFDETAGTALTENDAAASRVDNKRAQVHVIEDATTRGRRMAVNVNGGASSNLMSSTRSDTYTVAANGTTIDCSTNPLKCFSIQVKGTGAAATAWDVVLEGSLNNVNFTTIVSHGTADLDGTTKSFATPFPVLYLRSRCASITLGGATNVVATILGVQ